MDRRSQIAIAIAVVIGLFAVYIANAWFSGREAQQEQIADEQGLVEVAVASQDLQFGAPISMDTVRFVSWPENSVPQGAIRNSVDITNERNVAIRPIARGEPILNSRISNRAILSANIQEGMRAVTVPVNAVTGVAGFIVPGDTVDVLLTRQIPGDGADSDDRMTTVVLERIQVLAIDRRSSENSTEPEVGDTATLMVGPLDAQRLTLANQIGRLSLVLRNVEDENMGETRLITRRDLGGGGLYIADRSRSSAPARSAAAPALATAPPAAASRSRGPTMLVYRGTEATRQEVLIDGQ